MIFSFVALFLLNYSFAKDLVNWKEVVTLLSTPSVATSPRAYSCDSKPQNDLMFLPKTTYLPIESDYCVSQVPNAYSFCRSSMRICERMTGSSGCINTNQVKAKERRESPLFDQIKKYTSTQFYNFLNNPSVQDRCCKDNQVCKDRFKKTKLNFVETKALVEEMAETKVTVGGTSIVRIAHSTLTNALSQGYIDLIVVHELAHACQHSRNLNFIVKTNDLLNYSFWAKPTVFDINELYPEDQARCLEKAINNPDKSVLNKGRAAAEIFANTFYIDHFSIEGFAFLCSRGAGEGHTDDRSGLSCVVSSREFQKKICNYNY